MASWTPTPTPVSSLWQEELKNTSMWKRTGYFRPQSYSVMCCHGNVYFYESGSLQMLSQEDIYNEKPNNALHLHPVPAYEESSVYCRNMDRALDRYIAIAAETTIGNESESFVSIFDTKRPKRIVQLKHPKSIEVDTVKYTNKGQNIFSMGNASKYNWNAARQRSTSSNEGNVQKWDVSTQSVTCSYDIPNYFAGGCLAPASLGIMFLTSDKNNVSLWDTRTEHGKVREFAFSAHSMGFIEDDRLFTMMGCDKNGACRGITLDFASFKPMAEKDPDFVEFDFNTTKEGFLITTFGKSISVGYNNKGEVGLWDNKIRGSPIRLDAEEWCNGPNSISLSEKEDMIAISGYSAQKSKSGPAGAIATIRKTADPDYLDKHKRKLHACNSCKIQ